MQTDYTKQSTAELRALFADLTETINAQKAMISAINAELLARYGSAFAGQLQALGKNDGSLSDERDGVKLTYDVEKKVKWDNEKLKAIAATMDWATASRVFKIEFAVPESVYKAIPDVDLVKRLNEARTVTIKEPTITFAKK
jgi:hypothetical protein